MEVLPLQSELQDENAILYPQDENAILYAQLEAIKAKREKIPIDHEYLNPTLFRPGSHCRTIVQNFLITNGGIGDYICWMSAIEWIARTHPQLKGRIYAPKYFLPIVENVMAKYLTKEAGWKVAERAQLTPKKMQLRRTYAPHDEPISGTSCHLVDLGFIYYAGLVPVPADGRNYLKLDLTSTPDTYSLPKDYAVMTPGATYENRVMPVKAFNALKNHFLAEGVTPVFLGTAAVGSRSVQFAKDYDYENGLNLVGETSLLQAAKIIAGARVIVGLDNGLLHLAAMTEVPIVFGYNIASPEHRRPRRLKGELWEIYPDTLKLSCTFCQSKMRFMFNHDFRICAYEDNLCLTALSDPKPWIESVDKALALT